MAVPAHVVGFSIGGMVALSLLAQHPDIVRSLGLVGTTARSSDAQAEVFGGRASGAEAGMEELDHNGHVVEEQDG